MNNLDRNLAGLHAREIDFARFMASTRREYAAMAQRLLRKWATPPSFSEEDTMQELYVATWRVVWKFDPARGVPLSRFVIFNATSMAKREVHRARGVTLSGNADVRPSCFEICASGALYYEDGDDAVSFLDMLLAEKAVAEVMLCDRADVREAATKALRACTTPRERTAVLAIREAGSLDGAGAVLYGDLDTRLDFRLGSEEKAHRFVQRHAATVALRMRETTDLQG